MEKKEKKNNRPVLALELGISPVPDCGVSKLRHKERVYQSHRRSRKRGRKKRTKCFVYNKYSNNVSFAPFFYFHFVVVGRRALQSAVRSLSMSVDPEVALSRIVENDPTYTDTAR